jgi:hypothetical protein
MAVAFPRVAAIGMLAVEKLPYKKPAERILPIHPAVQI